MEQSVNWTVILSVIGAIVSLGGLALGLGIAIFKGFSYFLMKIEKVEERLTERIQHVENDVQFMKIDIQSMKKDIEIIKNMLLEPKFRTEP